MPILHDVTELKDPREAERAELLDRLNAAVRRPDAHGGTAALPPLLDALAEAGRRSAGERWIADEHARLNMAVLLRASFPAPEIHVLAAEYGDAAHRHGWLHLDRALREQEYADLLETAEDWTATDRTLRDVLDAYGPPSVTFGPTEPHLPKTLGYTTAVSGTPLAVFHFADAEQAPSARLLAFRCKEEFLSSWMALTPLGEALMEP